LLFSKFPELPLEAREGEVMGENIRLEEASGLDIFLPLLSMGSSMKINGAKTILS
jgi:hypothetical protein